LFKIDKLRDGMIDDFSEPEPELLLSAYGMAQQGRIPIRFVRNAIAEGAIAPAAFYGPAALPVFRPSQLRRALELYEMHLRRKHQQLNPTPIL
jgi:hypothetical protein